MFAMTAVAAAMAVPAHPTFAHAAHAALRAPAFAAPGQAAMSAARRPRDVGWRTFARGGRRVSGFLGRFLRLLVGLGIGLPLLWFA